MRTPIFLLILLLAHPLSGCDLFGGQATEDEEVEGVEEEEDEEEGEDMSHPRWYFPLAVGNEWHFRETYQQQQAGQTQSRVVHTRRRVVAAEAEGRFRVEITSLDVPGPNVTTQEVTWYYDESAGAVFQVNPYGYSFQIGCKLDAVHGARGVPCAGFHAGTSSHRVRVTNDTTLAVGNGYYRVRAKSYATDFGPTPRSTFWGFAQGIGPVILRVSWVHFPPQYPGQPPPTSGSDTHTLWYARVGAQVYGSPLAF